MFPALIQLVDNYTLHICLIKVIILSDLLVLGFYFLTYLYSLYVTAPVTYKGCLLHTEGATSKAGKPWKKYINVVIASIHINQYLHTRKRIISLSVSNTCNCTYNLHIGTTL